jgi:hypothetical protein
MKTYAILTTLLLGAAATAQQGPDKPPTVAITSPANGSRVSGRVTVRISAQDDRGIRSVSLTIDPEACIGGNTVRLTAPYTYSWNTRAWPNGLYALRATAVDTAGQSRSVQIVVRVANAQVERPQQQ